MREGIHWSWETFPEFLDTIDRLPKGINYAAYIGHSALRTYVMGERAFTEPASELTGPWPVGGWGASHWRYHAAPG